MKRVIESDEFRCAKHYGCMDGFPTLNSEIIRVLKELIEEYQFSYNFDGEGEKGFENIVCVSDIQIMIEKLEEE